MRPLRFCVLLAALLGGCQLPPTTQVLFRCGALGACGAELQCWPDGYCHPLSDGPPTRDAGGVDASVDAGLPDAGVDAGLPDAGEEDAGEQDAGPCLPLAACPSSAECGAFDAGCGVRFECGSCSAPDECGTQKANVCALPRLCQQGFCWENPLPQGNTLFGVFAFGPRAVWAVGEAGTVLFWNGERTQLIDVGTTADLRGIYGTSTNELFVVGDQGTIVRFDGSSWVRETVSGVYRINVVWVAANGAAFAGANGGSVLKRGAGGVWSEMILSPSNTADIVALTGLSDGQVFATTFARVYRLPTLSSNTWVGEAPWPGPSRDTLLMSSLGSRLFAGGKLSGQNYGQVLERQPDAGWRQYGPNIPMGFTALNVSVDALFVGSPGGVITKLELDGGLSPAPLSRDGGIFGLATLAAGTVFAVGEWGTMAIVADAGVRELSYGGVARVNGLCGDADARVYGAADDFSVFERRSSSAGVRWDSVTRAVQNGNRWLSCFADGPDRVWVMSDDRYYLRQVGGVFVRRDTSNGSDWLGVWGSASGPYYFVNDSAQIYSSVTGDAPNSTSGTFGPAQGIWGVAADDVLVVTGSGQVRIHTTSWSDLTEPEPNRNLRGVHGRRFLDGGVVYSVVGHGTAWRRNNGVFTADFLDAGHALRGTWVTAQGDIWAAGDDGGVNLPQGRGVLWRFVADAGTWVQLPSPTARPFNAITGYGETGPFIGGSGGAILRKQGADGG